MENLELLVGLAACAEAVGGEGEGIGFEIGSYFPHAWHPVDAADLNASRMPPPLFLFRGKLGESADIGI